MSASEKQVAELIRKGWIPVDGENALFINAPLFRQGFISFLDPDQCQTPPIEENEPFDISKKRSIVVASNDKSSRKAKQYFNLPATTVSLRNVHRRDECYVPVVVANEQGKAAAALYIHPRKIGPEDPQTAPKPFTAFHTETCLLGSQLSCRTSNGSIRHFTKHHVEFLEGEYITAITSAPGDNSYETMQLEEHQLMAMLMASYSLKGANGRPQAQVIHHLPWLDYVISAALLWHQGRMSYEALLTLCEIMLSKKIEHEQKIGNIYSSLGLAFRFITPFDNLLDPTKPLTAESILEQLGINERERASQLINPGLEAITDLLEILSSEQKEILLSEGSLDSELALNISDRLQRKKHEKIKLREKDFVNKYLALLTENSFDLEQKHWWEVAITRSGKQIDTLDNFLEIANALAMAIAASTPAENPENANACSVLSTQGKQIQVVYEKLYKSEDMRLPPVTCWTSLPLFLTHSQSARGTTFYFEYSPHAATITGLIERNIVGGAISNMVANILGQETISVKRYLDSRQHTPYHTFFRPISDAKAPEVAIMPGVKTLQTPIVSFIINGAYIYDPEIDNEVITFGDSKSWVNGSSYTCNLEIHDGVAMFSNGRNRTNGSSYIYDPDIHNDIITFGDIRQPMQGSLAGDIFLKFNQNTTLTTFFGGKKELPQPLQESMESVDILDAWIGW